MLSTAYIMKRRAVKGGIIQPQAGEYVASLLERGLFEEAAAVQADQYRQGVWLALHGYPAGSYLPAATWQGYRDTLAGS